MKKNVRMYGCGGAGINLVSKYVHAGDEPGVANLMVAFVDTSRSNLAKLGLDSDDNLFVVKKADGDEADGSGKERAEHHVAMANQVKALLQQFPPEAFNIVVFSASGGSGSPVGSIILAELLHRGLPAVAVVVGSHESEKTASNTVKTMKTLENIATKSELPVVMSYHINMEGTKRSDVDHQARLMIGSLSYLASGENDGLDSTDIKRFVQYPDRNSGNVQLHTLDVFYGPDEVNTVESPLAIASLYANPDAHDLTVKPEYNTDGYPPAGCQLLMSFPSMHLVIRSDEVGKIFKHATSVLDEIESRHRARVKQESILGKDDNIAASGLVL